MLLSKILKDCKKDIEFKKTAVDSRKVEKGDLFAVFTGSAELNRQYAEDAVRRGAAAVLTDDESCPFRLRLCAVKTHRFCSAKSTKPCFSPCPRYLPP